MTAVRPDARACLVLAGLAGCGGRTRSAPDASGDATDDANSGDAPFGGSWDATRNECPNGVYTELRDATWSLRLTASTYTDSFSTPGCQASTTAIPIAVQGNLIQADLSLGTQSCSPSPSCRGSYSATDTGSPNGVSYSILLCPKTAPGGRPVEMDWAGDTLSYTVPGGTCVQHFVRRL